MQTRMRQEVEGKLNLNYLKTVTKSVDKLEHQNPKLVKQKSKD